MVTSKLSARKNTTVTRERFKWTSKNAACRAVFGTYELLENIIVLVPPHHIPKLRHVSKAWNKIVTSSSHVRKARCLPPTAWTVWTIERVLQHFPEASTPVYEPTSAIRLHPMFDKYERRLTTVGFSDSFFHRMQQSSSDYATVPRCQMIHICLQLDHEYSQCTAYAKDGVQIRDLLQVPKALLTTSMRYAGWPALQSRTFNFRISFMESDREGYPVGRTYGRVESGSDVVEQYGCAVRRMH